LHRKKIVILGPSYPYRGGNALFVSYVYDILKDKYDVKVINYTLLYPSILFPGTTQQDKSNLVLKQVPNTRLINSINPLTWGKTAKAVKGENPDLIIFDWWNPFFGPSHNAISRKLKKDFKDKILFITENVISHEGRFIDKFLTKLGLKHPDKFLVLSKTVEDSIKEYSKGRKVYKSALPIYDSYNITPDTDLSDIRKSLGFSDTDRIILFFGYVRKYKGLNILIDAMPALLKYNKDIRLLIVGEFYDSADKYYELINRLRLKDKIKVVQQFVPNEEVWKYYTISELVVLPYIEATQSGVLNIAYGFRKPVVVTNVGGLAEDVVIGKTGYVVKSNEVQSLAEGIKEYFENADKTDFTKNVEEKLKDNEFNKLPQLIEKIINESN
jgi:glycosyltransferase involved in cell wall biosynthesis